MPARKSRAKPDAAAAPAVRTLYVVRHAKAVERGTTGHSEFSRPLTEKGVEGMRAVAAELRRRRVPIDRVLSSPLVRARQTARLLADAFRLDVTLVDWFRPGAAPRAVLRALDRESGRRVALVGHEPDCGSLAGLLLFGDASEGPAFRKAMVVACERSGTAGPGQWVLRFRLRRKHLDWSTTLDD